MLGPATAKHRHVLTYEQIAIDKKVTQFYARVRKY